MYSGFIDAVNRQELNAAEQFIVAAHYRGNCVGFTHGSVGWEEAQIGPPGLKRPSRPQGRTRAHPGQRQCRRCNACDANLLLIRSTGPAVSDCTTEHRNGDRTKHGGPRRATPARYHLVGPQNNGSGAEPPAQPNAMTGVQIGGYRVPPTLRAVTVGNEAPPAGLASKVPDGSDPSTLAWPSRCPAALRRRHWHPAAQRSWSCSFAPGDTFLTRLLVGQVSPGHQQQQLAVLWRQPGQQRS